MKSVAKRPTVHDIAKTASVSLATVDRVLNTRPGVRENTIIRVNEAISRLGYKRDVAAANLARQRNYRLAFVLPDEPAAITGKLNEAIEEARLHAVVERTQIETHTVTANDPYKLAAILRNLEDLGLDVLIEINPEGEDWSDHVGEVRSHLEPLTEEHTLVAWQLKQGIITEAEAARSPHRNVITRAVGSREYVQVDTGFFEVQPMDAFMLCSDGLHGYLQDHEIPDVIDMGPKGAAERFIHMANSRGGRDNITAIVVNVR